MIYFYCGVPGSGKSLHAVMDICRWLRSGRDVISCRLDVDVGAIKPKKNKPLGHFSFFPTDTFLHNDFYPRNRSDVRLKEYSYIAGLYGYANNYHRRKKDGTFYEHQTLLVFDECQDIWNSRTWNRSDRLDWCHFFQLHRHYGFDVIMISQSDTFVDKQIRAILQEKVYHRSFAGYKVLGKVVALLCGGTCFIAVHSLYGMAKKDSRLFSDLFTGRRFFKYYSSTSVDD